MQGNYICKRCKRAIRLCDEGRKYAEMGDGLAALALINSASTELAKGVRLAKMARGRGQLAKHVESLLRSAQEKMDDTKHYVNVHLP